MPAGILSRFIVKSHSFIKNSLFWKYGVVLEYENTQALIEEDYIDGRINIFLKGDNKKGLLSAIRMYIFEVHKDFDKAGKLVFEEMVQCNCSMCKQSANPHFFKFKVLKNFELNSIEIVPCDVSTKPVKIKSLINDVQLKSYADLITTNTDLKNYILQLISSVLERDILLKSGYINFWRDQRCTDPKTKSRYSLTFQMFWTLIVSL